jgi:hypothetical protein
MKFRLFSIFALLAFAMLPQIVFAQQQEVLTLEEQVEKEAERLQRVLELEDWQVFYVDSTLMHDIPAMRAEISELASAKVANSSVYQMVQDKWMDQIDATYMKIFTPEQWAMYLKQGAAKQQKARAKRKAKN